MAQVFNNPSAAQLNLHNEANPTSQALQKLTGQTGVLQLGETGRLSLTLLGQTIVLPKLSSPNQTNNAQQKQAVTLKVQQSTTQTILELVQPKTHLQSAQLTPSQGQQLLNVAVQNPALLTQTHANQITAKVTQLVGDQVTFQLAQKAITIKIPQAAAKLQQGETVVLTLRGGAQGWQLNVSPAATSKTNGDIDIQPAQRQIAALLNATLPRNVATPIAADDKIALLQIQRLLPVQLQSSFPTNATQLATGKQHDGSAVAGSSHRANINTNLHNTAASITMDDRGAVKVQWQGTDSALARIPLEGQFKQQVIDALVKSANQQENSNAVKTAGATFEQGSLTSKNPLQMLAANVKKVMAKGFATKTEASGQTQPSPDNSNQSALAESSNKSLIKSLNAAQREQLQGILSPMLRSLHAKADAPATIAKALQNTLAALVKNIDPPLGQYLTELAKHSATTPLNPAQTQDTSEQIQQLLSAPPVTITRSSLSGLNSASGINHSALSGLVSMLQVTLAARLSKQQPHHMDKLVQTLAPMLANNNAKAPSKPQIAKGLADLLRTDNTQQMLRNLNAFVTTHQSSKLRSIESQLQGQEGLYYVLPLEHQGVSENVELLIRKASEQGAQPQQQQLTNQCWLLTMKLPVGELGQVLAKAKLLGQDLEIDFYTSNTHTKELLFNFIPVLKKRMQKLGIAVNKCQCQLGKIPDELLARPYHLFEAKA